MATSGSFVTSDCTPQSRTWYFEVNWWVESWSGNTATIKWECYARAKSGSSSSYIYKHGWSGSIAGNAITSDKNPFYKDQLQSSGSFTLAGGTYFTASLSVNPYSTSYTSSGSGGWTLDNNVITPSVSVSASSPTESSIYVSMSVTHNGYQSIKDNYIDVYSDSGCTNRVGGISGTSGTVSGLSRNTTYYVRANASNGYYRGYSSVTSITTYNYPYITSIDVPTLTIGNSQKVNLYNPLGRNVTVYMKKDNNSGTQLYSGSTTGTSLTFTPSASTLYSSIPESVSSYCVYYCVYDNTNIQNVGGYYQVSGNNNQAPTFTDFNYKDTDPLASQLTGKNGVNNPGVLVSGISDCEFTVTAEQKATSGYGAALDHYNFAWPNGIGKSGIYSSNANVTGNVYDGNSNVISVSAYDKRGQYKTVSKTITLITPTHASSQVNTVRKNGIEAVTYLAGSISYWAGDWVNGASRPNNIHKIEYRVNKTGSYYDITSAVVNNSTNSMNGKIKTLVLNSNTIQLHANGSSGGFTVGTSYVIEIFVSTGVTNNGDDYNYDDRQKVAEIIVTSGIFGMSRYKDSDGKYHYGINGLPDSSKTFKVHGSMDVKELYIRTVLKQYGMNKLYIGGKHYEKY